MYTSRPQNPLPDAGRTVHGPGSNRNTWNGRPLTTGNSCSRPSAFLAMSVTSAETVR